jgi:hypothetical protein
MGSTFSGAYAAPGTTLVGTKSFVVGAYTASPSMGVMTLPWAFDYAHLVFGFFS